jgi:gliding motility-associated-like protein
MQVFNTITRNILYIILILFSVQVNVTFAAHIVGGDVSYRCISVDSVERSTTFEIVFTIYRDSRGAGAPYDNPARFGQFIGSGNNWQFQRSFTHPVMDVRPIDIETNNPCVIVPTNVGVERGTYRFTVTLAWSDRSYLFTYQRCCRNNTINNIIDPQSTGATFMIEITPEAQTSCNNSPTFDNFPPVVICANQPLVFAHSATDVDGDQLVYEFCSPISGGGLDGSGLGTGPDPNSCTGVTPDPLRCPPPYDEVVFNIPAGFTFANPMGGDPQVRINPATGLITGIPQVQGQFVIGVCVSEFRDGQLISRINRDFQFNVTFCQVAVNAVIGAQGADVEFEENLPDIGRDAFVVNSCGSNTVNFTNFSTDLRFIERFTWEFEIDGQTETFETQDATVTFPDLGTYNGIMILNRDLPAAQCSDTAFIKVNIFPTIDADFSFVYDTCVAGPVSFTDQTVSGSGEVTGWRWNFDNVGQSAEQNPDFTFRTPGTKNVQLLATDINNCRDSLIRDISYLPVPPVILIDPTTFIGCAPARVFFNNLSEPIDDSYDIFWDFGDGNFSEEISPLHVFEDIGTYSVSIEITSPIGCFIERTFNSWIEILPGPKAGFSFSPENPNSFNREVRFFDESSDATSISWRFSDISSSFDRNPVYTFPDTGFYLVQQIVVHESGCADTAVVLIDIEPLVVVEMPNAFTPNNDGLNDGFRGFGFNTGLENFRMSIWNRWGEMIFETSNPSAAWNGTKNNTGPPAPPGVYVYMVEYDGPRGGREVLRGHVTLIR